MCDDFPCCGHEQGCCPDRDESGNQINMKCVCGASVPLKSRSSLCKTCLANGLEDDGFRDSDLDDEEFFDREAIIDLDWDT